ncbi:MAG: MotA/TolQ/ExbB proton channel family protein [Candidatus Adiutrix intracellularis]|nr:MotA/TolQ/ExbB proton channel family protein [Candidatus Adiutrix intracellularis]
MMSAPTLELSVKNIFLNADPMVQGIMIILFLASLVCWIIIFEKIIILRQVSREIYFFKKAATSLAEGTSREFFHNFAQVIVKTGIAESRDTAGAETRADFRERVERSMRQVLAGYLDQAGDRTLFLATVGATAPFVGLFGTVWGIIHSFVSIAASGGTSLAVVAPGIAEALFATAMGLIAAIPAVITYNKITSTMKKITMEALAGIDLLGNHLARLHFSRKD